MLDSEKNSQDKLAFCSVCGEFLGRYRDGFAKNHLAIYPEHQEFLVKTIIDPLMLSETEFRSRMLRLNGVSPTVLKRPEETTKDGTEYKKMMKVWAIKQANKSVNTRPEQLFNQFQLQEGLGLIQDVMLDFADQGEPYTFQLDFARPANHTFDTDFEIDGAKFHSSDTQRKKDAWKDMVKNRQGLKVIHIPAILCNRVHWSYLAREINRAILSTQGSIYIEA